MSDEQKAKLHEAAPAVNLDFPEKFEEWFYPRRYKIAYGGRGSAKSHSAARALIKRSAETTTRWLCAREIQTSIKQSVHRLLCDQIASMRMGHLFEITDTEIRGRYNGSLLVFAGIRTNVASIKSMEGLDGVWVEEAEKVSDDSWQVLIPTLRKPGSEIWATFNPDLVTDATYQRFVVNTPPDCLLLEMNWQDNPWFPEVLRREKDWLYRTDPDAAEWVWGGKCRTNSEANVLRNKYIVEPFHDSLWRQADALLFGADFGFAVDPSTLIRCFVIASKLYVDSEAYGVSIELNDLPRFYNRVPGARRWPIKADCSRPETISHLRGAGFAISAAKKWSGSVEDGVAYLRGFEQIVIHPRCKHTSQEARLYSYKINKNTREVLPEIQDKNNHCWDAVRYALDGLITRRGDVGIYAGIAQRGQAEASEVESAAADNDEELV